MSNLPDFAVKKLDRAYSALETGDIRTAREIYSSLRSKYKRHAWIDCLHGALLIKEDSVSAGLEIIMKSADQAPDQHTISLAMQHFAIGLYPGIALSYYRKLTKLTFCEDHISKMANACLSIIKSGDNNDVSPSEMEERARLQDAGRLLLSKSDFQGSAVINRKIISRWSKAASAHNNLALCLFQLNDIDGALECIQKVIAFDPNNFFTLATEALYLNLLSQPVLAHAPCSLDERYPQKQVEYFTLTGNYQHAIKLSAKYLSQVRKLPEPEHSRLLQATAFSYAKLGQIEQARKLWKMAVDSDLTGTFKEGDSLWLVNIQEVMSTVWIEEAKRRPEEFIKLVSLGQMKTAIEFGSPVLLQLACTLESKLDNPMLQQALLDRVKILEEKDRAIAFGPLSRLNRIGEVTEILQEDGLHPVEMNTIKIVAEPRHRPNAKAQQCMERGLKEMCEYRFEKAKAHFRNGIKLDPDCPAFHFNLANCSLALRENKIADKILEELQVKFPDYFFGKVIHIRKLLVAGELKTAEPLLKELISGASELHAAEYAAYLSCSTRLAVIKNEAHAAKATLKMWKTLIDDFGVIPGDFSVLQGEVGEMDKAWVK